jgi:hypothetical protein
MPGVAHPPTSRPTGITGSQKVSSQYRAYERIACLDSPRNCPSDASTPITRRKLPSSTSTPGALAPPREVGEEPEGTLRPQFGQAADNRPAEAIPGIGQPVLQPWHRYLPRPAGYRSGTGTISHGPGEHL